MNIAGQLNEAERRLLTDAILGAPTKPKIALEVGTWLGGGSTLHLLRALEENGTGHLWGIEADESIYDRMLANIRSVSPALVARFTPLFGFSEEVIPRWLAAQPRDFQIDAVFLDGGNNPAEQITEFRLLNPYLPVGGILMSHDAKLRKGKWLIPYLQRLDNWESQLHDVSEEGFFFARKTAPQPSCASLSAARAHLHRMRLQPVEIVAAFLPASICGAVLRLLPARLSLKLAQGRG